MKKRVADIIMNTLVDLGVSDCFAVVGGGAMYLDNALLHCNKIRKIFNHHEQASAIAAEGYARLSGRIPLVCCTSGPGTTNTLTGVMGAWVDSIPMLIISGQMRYAVTVKASGLPLRSRGSQEFNIVDTVKTMTKYSRMVINPNDIKSEVEKAYHIAMSGRRGPVWLDIPLDVQMAEIEENNLKEYRPEENVYSVKDSDIKQLRNLITLSKRPVILAGQSIAATGNLDKFKALVNKIGIPVVSTLNASDVLGRECSYFYGGVGTLGQRAANFIIQNADFILTLGASLDFDTTGYNQDEFAKNAYIAMVDIDVFEVQKPGVRVDYFIHSDLGTFIDAILVDVEKLNVTVEWKNYCDSLKQKFSYFESSDSAVADDRVCQYYFWKEFEKYEENDAITALGNNTAIVAKQQAGVLKTGQRIICNCHCGSMGYDLPAAEGAAVASGRTVYCATGDGSIMMNLQELQTIHHYNLPIKIIVFSNEGYNAIRQTSKNYFDGELIGCTPATGVSFPHFDKVADTFEFKFRECHTNAEVDESIKWLVNTDGQVMLLVDELLDDPVVPKVMSRVDENGNFMTPALQDMYPFLPKEEINKFMKLSEDAYYE